MERNQFSIPKLQWLHRWSLGMDNWFFSHLTIIYLFVLGFRLIDVNCPRSQSVNTMRPKHNCRHFAEEIFKCIFLNVNVRNSLKFSPTCVPKVRINTDPALVQIMAWRRPGDKPLSEPLMVSLLTHIGVTRPQWVKVCGCRERITNIMDV